MKMYNMHKSLMIVLFFLLTSTSIVYGQARVVINNAFINIKGDAQFVIDNPNPNAITRLPSGGHFISEGEDNNIRWNIRNNNGVYKVPFGMGTSDYLPLEFTTSGGQGNGYFELATYGGPNFRNSDYLPTGISNFHGFKAPDNSPYVMDRFWKIKARGYNNMNDDRPEFHFLSLSYRDIEYQNVGNTIIEGDVFIQRYNPILDSWYDYIPAGGAVSNDVVNNTVSVQVVPREEIFDWWVIVDAISPLPVELLSFEAQAINNQFVLIDWSTATERNMDKFVVERSQDGKNWEFVAETAAQNLNTLVKYQTQDKFPYTGISYYRLKQVEFNGNVTYSVLKEVNIYPIDEFAISIFPNPTIDYINLKLTTPSSDTYSYEIYAIDGKKLIAKTHISSLEKIDCSLFPSGMYFIKINNVSKGEILTRKFEVTR